MPFAEDSYGNTDDAFGRDGPCDEAGSLIPSHRLWSRVGTIARAVMAGKDRLRILGHIPQLRRGDREAFRMVSRSQVALVFCLFEMSG